MGRETPEGVRVRGLLLEAPRWLLGCEARDGACQPLTCPPRCDPRRHILTLLGWGGEKVLYLLEALPSCTRKIQGRRPTRPGWAERLRRVLRGWECLCCSDLGGSLGGQSHSEVLRLFWGVKSGPQSRRGDIRAAFLNPQLEV